MDFAKTSDCGYFPEPQPISEALIFPLEESKEIEHFYGKLEFDFGQLVHPTIGVHHVTGDVPLILPEGVYSDPNPESVEKVYEYLVKWSDDHGVEFRSRRHRNEQIRLSINIIGSTFEGDLCSPLLVAASVVTLIFFVIDDLNEDTDILTLDLVASGREGGADGFRVNIEEILAGKYKNVTELPPVELPMLEPFPLLTFLVYELLMLHHQGLGLDASFLADSNSQLTFEKAEIQMRACEKSCRDLQKEFIQAMSLMFNPNFIESGSERLFFKIRSLEVGGTVLIEWVFAHMRHKIPIKIRSSVLFKLCVQSGAEACALIQDIFSLRKELNEKYCANLVLMKVRRQGMTLPDAMASILNLLKDKLVDVRVCTEKLLEDHPECEDLKMFIKMGKYSTDGQTLMYRLPGCMLRYEESEYLVTYYESLA